jgi:hypothetical protein
MSDCDTKAKCLLRAARAEIHNLVTEELNLVAISTYLSSWPLCSIEKTLA